MSLQTEVAAAAAGAAAIIGAMYTSSELLTIIASVGGLVTIMGVAVVNIIVSLRTNRVAAETKEAVKEVIGKTEVIAGHVNSAATKAAEQIVALQTELSLLREALAEKKETAALLAQAAAVRPAEPAPATTHAPAEVIVVNTPDTPIPVTTPKK